MRNLLRSTILIVALALVSCGQKAIPPDGEQLDITRVERDAQDAVASGDARFLGVAGYSISLPGVENAMARTVMEKDNFRVIAGTSDFPLYPDYQERALRYAEVHNRVILKLAAQTPAAIQ